RRARALERRDRRALGHDAGLSVGERRDVGERLLLVAVGARADELPVRCPEHLVERLSTGCRAELAGRERAAEQVAEVEEVVDLTGLVRARAQARVVAREIAVDRAALRAAEREARAREVALEDVVGDATGLAVGAAALRAADAGVTG